MAVIWPRHPDNYHIQYFYTDVLRLNQLGHSYFASPYYLAVWAYICAKLLHTDQIAFNGPSIYRYTKFYSGMAEYEVNIFTNDVITTSPAV